MKRKTLRAVVFLTFAAVVALSGAAQLRAQAAKDPYPNIAPVEQYMMERDAEIALARSAAPDSISKDAEVMAGRTKEQMIAEVTAALDSKELPQQERGAMCYMMSKDGYLNDGVGHWHPHLMFFLPIADAATWGANLPGSPVLSSDDPLGRLTIFMIPVGKWSDGTPAH